MQKKHLLWFWVTDENPQESTDLVWFRTNYRAWQNRKLEFPCVHSFHSIRCSLIHRKQLLRRGSCSNPGFQTLHIARQTCMFILESKQFLIFAKEKDRLPIIIQNSSTSIDKIEREKATKWPFSDSKLLQPGGLPLGVTTAAAK